MSKSNKKSSSLISGLKSSFSSGNKLSLSSLSKKSTLTPVVSSPLINQKNTQQVPSEPNNVNQKQTSQGDQLEVLDKIIKQVESEREPVLENRQAEVISQVESTSNTNNIQSTEEVSVQQPIMQDDSLEAIAQAVPQTIASAQDPLNPTNPVPVGVAKKENFVVGSGVTSESLSQNIEQNSGVQTIEQESTPEISPEIESFIQHAEQQEDHLPQEIVIADNMEVSSVTHHPKKPVIVLPITAEEQKIGKGKNTKMSIRWLVEWSVKLMKKFSGEVIYREEK